MNNDRAHGQQFKARFLKTSAPSSIDGIEKYLGSGIIQGIGPVYAGKMVKAFGEKVFDVMETEPDRLREVACRTDDPDVPGKPIGMLSDDLHGVGAVGLEDANCEATREGLVLLGPGGRQERKLTASSKGSSAQRSPWICAERGSSRSRRPQPDAGWIRRGVRFGLGSNHVGERQGF